MSDRLPVDLRQAWSLDPATTFLNHGSFGACPRAVLEFQSGLREEMEAEPVRFFVARLEARLDHAREGLARFLGADPENLAFVPNATVGVNTVLASLSLEAGDELLTTDHAYGACRNALERWAGRARARVVVANIPFPLPSEDLVLERVLERVGPQTRLALVDHVTSPTGIVFPVERLVRRLRELGVETLVDGAHAPGMVDLGLEALGATYYIGNLHKWLCAPKGAGFLHVRSDRRGTLVPLVTSHGAGSSRTDRSRFRLEFDWTGTDDPTPYLSVPEAIRHLASLVAGGWPEIRAANHGLALQGRAIVLAALGTPSPVADRLVGSMASIELPDRPASAPGVSTYGESLQDALVERFRIQVPIQPWPHPGRRILRLSAHLYNRTEEYEALARALSLLLAEER